MEQLFPLSWKLDDILRFLYISHSNWLSHVIELHLCPHNISWQICWCFLLGKCSHKNRTGAGVADWPGRQRKAQSRWGHNEARGGGRLTEATSVWHHSGYSQMKLWHWTSPPFPALLHRHPWALSLGVCRSFQSFGQHYPGTKCWIWGALLCPPWFPTILHQRYLLGSWQAAFPRQ